MKKRPVCAALAIAAHLFLLALVLVRTAAPATTKPPPPTGGNPPDVALVGIQATLVTPTVSMVPAVGVNATCPTTMQSYVGIGVIYDGLTGLIETASPLYPAAQAGIRVGDILRDDLRHTAPTVGQLLQVHIERDGQLLTFSIRAVRICFKVKQP